MPNPLQTLFKKIKVFFKILHQSITDLLFPIECLGCKKYGEWVCRKCLGRIEFVAKQSCPKCKTENNYGEFCEKCRSHFYLNGILVAGDYKNSLLSSLIKQMKYHFAQEVADALGGFLVLFLRNLANRNSLLNSNILNKPIWRSLAEIKNAPLIFEKQKTIIIPVPLHKKRLRWRGFNQAEEIAKIVSSKLEYPLCTEILVRKKYSKPQAKLSFEERLKNTKNCFTYTGGNLRSLSVILIDDVATTASTLEECAKTLKQNGAKEVWGLVVAKG